MHRLGSTWPLSCHRSSGRGADVGPCAARSRDETPVLRGAWLATGSTVDSLGSTVPELRSADDIVAYKSVGAALQDIAIAEMLLQRARAQGCGVPLPASTVPVAK